MTNTELLLQHLSPEVAEKVIITMQKAIEGVTRSFHIQKLYSTGTTCNITIFSYTKGNQSDSVVMHILYCMKGYLPQFSRRARHPILPVKLSMLLLQL